jgi:hypothetical protein
MASLSGHHWTTHGLADIAAFLIVGFVLVKRGISMDGTEFAVLVAGARSCVVAAWRCGSW